MAAPVESNSKAATAEPAPESPTTARPLDLDDDDVQETGGLESSAANTSTAAAAPAPGPAVVAGGANEPAPPPKPPRPMTEQQKNRAMLKEAFPSIDDSVIRAVLSASGGRIDPAFNALLEMTDPDAARDVIDVPPPQPPRSVASVAGTTLQSQLEADEQYARQLAQHFEDVGAYESRTSNRSATSGRPPRQQTGLDMDRNFQVRQDQSRDPEEREHSFVDDDLPVIKENLRKGFAETQKTVNTFFQRLKKRIDEEFRDGDDDHRQQQQQQQTQRQQYAPGRAPQPGGRPSAEAARRSGDYDRYDADPHVLGDDFAGIKLNSDGTPNRDARASPQPHLFRPPPPSTSSRPGGDARKVAFRKGADEIGDSHDVPPPVKDAAAGGGTKSSKWQPLSTVEPSPIAENDPFSLGDSEDEKDTATKGHKKSTSSLGGGEIKGEDSERLRRAAAQAMNDSIIDDRNVKESAAKKD